MVVFSSVAVEVEGRLGCLQIVSPCLPSLVVEIVIVRAVGGRKSLSSLLDLVTYQVPVCVFLKQFCVL